MTRNSTKESFETRLVPLDEITPYARNPRKNANAVDKVAASIKEFGWRQPIVVDEDMVVLAGHTRLLAARKLRLDVAPVHIAKGLTPQQAAAYRLMDNRSSEAASWDEELLGLELAELLDSGIDAELTGFDDFEISKLLESKEDREGEDDAPGPQAEPPVKSGELWFLGPHRVLCGDATSADDVSRLLGGVQPHLMVTDPPYGVNYDPTWRAEAGINKNKGKMGSVKNDDRADWQPAWELFPGSVAYVWHASLYTREVLTSLDNTGFVHRAMIIWVKDRFTLGRGDYHWQHEPCWYVVRAGAKGCFHGGRSQSTVWDIRARDDAGHGHGTQKPVECMRRPIVNNSSRGQAVYDPFLGSGTTLIAAESEGRICYGMEIDPVYLDVIIRRYEDHTGNAAKREDGKTYSEVCDGQ